MTPNKESSKPSGATSQDDTNSCKCSQRICKGVFETCDKCGGKNHCPTSCTKQPIAGYSYAKANDEDLFLYGKPNEAIASKDSVSGRLGGTDAKVKGTTASPSNERKYETVKLTKPSTQVSVNTGPQQKPSQRTSETNSVPVTPPKAKDETLAIPVTPVGAARKSIPSKSAAVSSPSGSNLLTLTGESKVSSPVVAAKKTIETTREISRPAKSSISSPSRSNLLTLTGDTQVSAAPTGFVKKKIVLNLSSKSTTILNPSTSNVSPVVSTIHDQKKSVSIPARPADKRSESIQPIKSSHLSSTKQHQLAKGKVPPRQVPEKRKQVWIIGDRFAHQAVLHEKSRTGKDSLGLENSNASVSWQVHDNISLTNFREYLDKTMIMANHKQPDYLVIHVGHIDFTQSSIEQMDKLIAELCSTIEHLTPNAIPIWSDILLRPEFIPSPDIEAYNNHLVRVNTKARTKFVLNNGKAIHHLQFTGQATELYGVSRRKKSILSSQGLDVFLDDLKEALKYFFQNEDATDYWGKG